MIWLAGGGDIGRSFQLRPSNYQLGRSATWPPRRSRGSAEGRSIWRV